MKWWFTKQEVDRYSVWSIVKDELWNTYEVVYDDDKNNESYWWQRLFKKLKLINIENKAKDWVKNRPLNEYRKLFKKNEIIN